MGTTGGGLAGRTGRGQGIMVVHGLWGRRNDTAQDTAPGSLVHFLTCGGWFTRVPGQYPVER